MLRETSADADLVFLAAENLEFGKVLPERDILASGRAEVTS